MEAFEQDIVQALEALHQGGLILFPSDTVWSIGCDATNEMAVQKLKALKPEVKPEDVVVLMADERDVLHWVAAPDFAVFDFVATQSRPTTIIFEHALGLAENLIAPDGSVPIRLVQDPFCRHLLKRFRKPVASAAAAKNGESLPASFQQIDTSFSGAVSYGVLWRRETLYNAQHSQVIRWNNGLEEWVRR